jgi:hypothetical protein
MLVNQMIETTAMGRKTAAECAEKITEEQTINLGRADRICQRYRMVVAK